MLRRKLRHPVAAPESLYIVYTAGEGARYIADGSYAERPGDIILNPADKTGRISGYSEASADQPDPGQLVESLGAYANDLRMWNDALGQILAQACDILASHIADRHGLDRI